MPRIFILALIVACSCLSDATAATINGQVVDRNTLAPIAGATVKLFAPGPMAWPVEIAQTQTDATGHYTIATSHPGSSVQSVSRAPGYAARSQNDSTCYQDTACMDGSSWVTVAPGGTATFDFRLAPAARITGRLRDAVTGTPPAESSVILSVLGQPAVNRYTIQAAADGSFVVKSLPAGTYELRSRADSSDPDRPRYLTLAWPDQYCDDVQVLCASMTAPFTVAEGQQIGELEFPLRLGSYLRMRMISDGNGQPVAQTTRVVRAQTLLGTASGTTQSDGYAHIGPLLPGGVKLELQPDFTVAYPAMGWPNLPCSGNPCDLSAAATYTISTDGVYTPDDVHVMPLRSVRGRVTDLVSAQPVAGVSVAAGRVDGTPAGTFIAKATAITDGNGNYQLEGFGETSVIVRTLPNGHGYVDRAWQTIECNGQNLFCSEIGVNYELLGFTNDPHHDQIDFALQQAAVLEGRVSRAGTGQPLINLRVIAIPASNPRMTLQAAVDTEGRFRIGSLSPDHYYLFATPLTWFGVINGYVYPQLPCWFNQQPAPHCDLTAATPFHVGYGTVISGIEFVLPQPDAIFESGFE